MVAFTADAAVVNPGRVHLLRMLAEPLRHRPPR